MLLVATQQRLVIFARRKSTDDLCASHDDDGIFIGKLVARLRRNVVKGHLSLPPSPTVSVYPRAPLVTVVVTNEPKWSFNRRWDEIVGKFSYKFLTFSRPLIVAVRWDKKEIDRKCCIFDKRMRPSACRRHMQLLFLYIIRVYASTKRSDVIWTHVTVTPPRQGRRLIFQQPSRRRSAARTIWPCVL